MAAMTPRRALVLIGAMLAGLVALPAPTPSVAGGVVVQQIDIGTAGPLGPVTVIGDSVLVGASYEPSLPTRLAELGWGPIRFRASGGGSTGYHLDDRHEASLANWVRWWRAWGWDAPTVMVNLGANDAGFCRGSVVRCAATIRHLMDQLGPRPTVVWGKITHLDGRLASAWNAALDLVASERANLVLWDWPVTQIRQRIPLSADRIHLPNHGAYRQRSQVMATELTDLVAGARPHDAPAVTMPTGAAAPSTYTPLAPRRLLDTRRAGQWLVAGQRTRIALGGQVPRGTTAVAVAVTTTTSAGEGHVTVWSCDGAAPQSSVLNPAPGRDRSAQAVVAATTGLCVQSSVSTHVLVDLQGAFTTSSLGSRLRPLTPQRVVDTRVSGRRAEVSFQAPSGATAVAVTITATGARTPGFVSAFGCGSPTRDTSVVNVSVNETVASSAYVPVGRGGRVCVSTTADTDVLVDLTASFHPGSSGLRFVPTAPTRLLDTRTGTGGWRGRQHPRQVLEVVAAPRGALAVTGTLTHIAPANDGFLTANACPGDANTSNVSTSRGGVMAASVTTAVDAGRRLCVAASTLAHTAFDLTGWWQR